MDSLANPEQDLQDLQDLQEKTRHEQDLHDLQGHACQDDQVFLIVPLTGLYESRALARQHRFGRPRDIQHMSRICKIYTIYRINSSARSAVLETAHEGEDSSPLAG